MKEIGVAFRILGLDPAPFRPLFRLSQNELVACGARRCIVDAMPGYPDRIALRDLAVGETAILINYTHQPADTAYRASHAIFVGETSSHRADMVDAIPEALRRRPISLRAFDGRGEMTDAALSDGAVLQAAIERLFADPAVAYLHAHYAVRGCYAARIERATADLLNDGAD
jgi:Protein of unknown function (DUF1203)